jgi:membrane protein
MPDTLPPPLQRLKDRLHHLFVGGDDLGSGKEPTRLQQFFHFWRLAIQSFVENRLPVRAASLSYTTILALVPMLAVVMGVTSSLLKDESEERIEQFVDHLVDSVVPPAVITNRPNDKPSAPETGQGDTEASLTTNLDVRASALPASAATNGAGTTVPPGESIVTPPDSTRAAVLDEGVQQDVARSLRRFIQNTRSGTLGVVGTGVLIFLAISMLIRIEDAFNQVWGVAKGRSLFLRLVLYWTVITLAPVLVGVALGLASGPHLAATQQLIADIPLVGWLLFQLLPLMVLILAFAVFYMLMPNTKVRWNAALIGGVVAALLWHINNSLSALYVSRVVTNFKIYGGLGLVPVFMIGLYFAWMILLFGGQVSYAWQNRMAYFQERLADHVNQRGREFVALRLMTSIGAAYQRGAEPPTHSQLSERLGIPPRLTQEILGTLMGARLITEVNGNDPGYVPARPIDSISCHDVLLALRASPGGDLDTEDGALYRQILGEFQRINDAERSAAESVSMLTLAERANLLLTDSRRQGPALEAHNPERT